MAGACTTLHSRNQRVKVASDPEGAKIIYKDQVLGVTPAFVNIPRYHHGTLILEKSGFSPVTLDLKTSYRWGDSFASNFVWFFYGQPVASLLDLLNETAWNYDKLSVIPLSASKHHLEKPLFPDVIAIAPPQEGYELLSDELGRDLQDKVAARYPHSRVIPFDETENEFYEYSYNNSGETDNANRDKLYDTLGTTHVVESSVQNGEKTVTVKADLTDIFTDKTVPAFNAEFYSADLKNDNPGFFRRIGVSLLSIVPNLLTFDFDSPSSNMNITSGPMSNSYTGVSDRTDTLLAILSSFGVRSVPSPKISESLKGVFRFVPVISFTYDRFNFQAPDGQPNSLQGYDFDWYTLIGGLGPEGGLDTSIGYFYLDLIPCYSINWITGSGNGADASTRTTTFTLLGEFGYQIFLSQRINLRLFARTVGIPSNAFSNLVPEMTGQNVAVDSASRSLAGLSLGYYFSEVRPWTKHLLF